MIVCDFCFLSYSPSLPFFFTGTLYAVPVLSYFQIKEYNKAEHYSQILLDIDKKNVEANNIKFNSLVRQNKMDAANLFLESSEVLKNQNNYNDLKSMLDPEFIKTQQKIIELNPPKKNTYILNYRKLFEKEKNNFI